MLTIEETGYFSTERKDAAELARLVVGHKLGDAVELDSAVSMNSPSLGC
jgi:hypothetical protein